MAARHVQPTDPTYAHALTTVSDCTRERVVFGTCGAFRYGEMTRWVVPLPPDFNRAEAARYLRVSPITITRLAPGRDLRGRKHRNARGLGEWTFSQRALDRFRFKQGKAS
jgi:hypothetical protein